MKIKCKNCKKLKLINQFYNKQSLCIECKKKYYKNRRHSLNRRYSIYKDGANKRGLKFNLNTEQFDTITQKNCYYCNGFSFKSKINGVDRINSNKDYDLNNCVPCCKTCNIMKMALGQNKFISQIKKISDNLKLNEY